MHYLISLKGGRFLVEDEGVVKIVEVSLPYPDCEYKGVRGSENIFERLGLSYTSSGHKEDAIQKVLAGKDEMPIKTFITKAKKFTEKNNKYKAYIAEKKQAEEKLLKEQEQAKKIKKEREDIIYSLSCYFDKANVDRLFKDLEDLDFEYLSGVDDLYYMFKITNKDISYDRLSTLNEAFNTLEIPRKGIFTFYKDVFSDIAGYASCIILYSLSDDFIIDDLLYGQYFYEFSNTSYEGLDSLDWNFEQLLYGEKVIVSYPESHENYQAGKSNIALQYTEFKEKYGE